MFPTLQFEGYVFPFSCESHGENYVTAFLSWTLDYQCHNAKLLITINIFEVLPKLMCMICHVIIFLQCLVLMCDNIIN